jgi:hypothetical protein
MTPERQWPFMSRGRWYFGSVVLTLTCSMIFVACSLDTPTSASTVAQSLAAAAPTISLSYSPYYLQHLCYPYKPYSARGCPTGSSVRIANTGGGTLNWTSTKSATWIKRSPRYGTAPSTVQVWVDGTGLPNGTYYGWIKVWATGATNSPQKVYITMNRWGY